MLTVVITILLLILLLLAVIYKAYAYSTDVQNDEPLITNLLSFNKDESEGKEYSLI
tara:strand:- start:12192 stop:12359 length:168 start_codon:yes stop_codon:yes gene_type:complete